VQNVLKQAFQRWW